MGEGIQALHRGLPPAATCLDAEVACDFSRKGHGRGKEHVKGPEAKSLGPGARETRDTEKLSQV